MIVKTGVFLSALVALAALSVQDQRSATEIARSTGISSAPVVPDVHSRASLGTVWLVGAPWERDKATPDHVSFSRDGMCIRSVANVAGARPHYLPSTAPILDADKPFYVEVSARSTSNDNSNWPAIWLMPLEHDGHRDSVAGIEHWAELDLYEGGFSRGPQFAAHQWSGVYPHYSTKPEYLRLTTAFDATKMHRFGLSWEPETSAITWWLDGRKSYSLNNPDVFRISAHHHFYLIMGAQKHRPQLSIFPWPMPATRILSALATGGSTAFTRIWEARCSPLA
ncbi:MAG TPA: hypothetical protein VFT56_02480 [Sphingomonas sp.]|nr:hypothetical protein [Sphingomonas sp.]